MIKTIKEAIQYIEDHLLDDIGPSDIGKHVYVSSFHLQRLFKAITTISLSEYIRNRRLSQAGEDVLSTEDTLLDIALKYQYESQEGFQKAFYRFHGVNPLKARQERAVLKTFHPLKIQIKFQGGPSMDYKIIQKEPFQLLCVRKKFPQSIIDEEDNTDIPDYWTEKLNDGTVKELLKHSSTKELYGPCGSVNQSSDYFYYGIGVEYGGQAIKDFELWKITHPLYAVFICQTKDDMGKTWEGITQDFIPNSKYQMADEPDFELYPNHDDYFCEIWVPIKR
ncbi:MAG: effector binding domain-containing protein [Candidatus Izemoplasmatales bacterium]